MVYLEAMASGLPVVATAAGGTAEAVLDGETGLLVEHGDAAETTGAIAKLLDDPALRARMGAAGRRRVLENYTLDRYAARVAEAYTRAVERRRGSVVVW
jgi:glycosyltransferase involved in cell wall biosynthesis